jgi:NOL1/NOP2/fmu family ribosome biogenesis protein
MQIKILNSGEKKKIIEDLNEKFGITELPWLLVMAGKGKIRAFSGSMTRDEIAKLSYDVRIELPGLYILREESDGYRISHDGLFIFKNMATKNIIDISDKQADEWLRGENIEIDSEDKWVLLGNKGELIGCGKVKDKKVINYVPRERRVK